MKYVLGMAGLAASASLACGGLFESVTIDFDDLEGGLPPVVTNGQFSPHATFSTDADSVLLVFSGAGFTGGSSPNSLSAGESPDASTFDSDIYIDFTQAAQNVLFQVLADNDSGQIATIQVFHGGGSDLVQVIGNGNFQDAIDIDLSVYADVTRVELFAISDEFGLGIDNLAFDVPVPAPGALAALGMAGLVAARRRRA